MVDQRPYWWPGISLEECYHANEAFLNDMVNKFFIRYLIPPSYTKKDARQEAYFGLHRAFETYKEERARFSTWMHYWIRHFLQRSLSSYLHLKAHTTISLDSLVVIHKGEEIPVQLEDRSTNSIEDMDGLDLLHHAIKGIPRQYQEVLMDVVGKGQRCVDVGNRLGVSRQRIAQMCQDALHLCRKRLGMPGASSGNQRCKAKYNMNQRIARALRRGLSVTDITRRLKVGKDRVHLVRERMRSKEVQA